MWYLKACQIMLKKICIFLIRGYQVTISPYVPKSCRFNPTCSQYAIVVISRYGIIKGLYLSIKRLFRCHPFGGSGYDPVP